MRYLILLLITTVLFSGSLQRNNSSETVIDQASKLIWMDNKDVVKLKLSHKEAVPYCEGLDYAGSSLWRIPTIEEFETIVDKNNHPLYINKAFRYNASSGYWAYQAHIRTFWFYADYMNFVSGTAYYDNRNKKKFVRCVRDIQ